MGRAVCRASQARTNPPWKSEMGAGCAGRCTAFDEDGCWEAAAPGPDDWTTTSAPALGLPWRMVWENSVACTAIGGDRGSDRHAVCISPAECEREPHVGEGMCSGGAGRHAHGRPHAPHAPVGVFRFVFI